MSEQAVFNPPLVLTRRDLPERRMYIYACDGDNWLAVEGNETHYGMPSWRSWIPSEWIWPTP